MSDICYIAESIVLGEGKQLDGKHGPQVSGLASIIRSYTLIYTGYGIVVGFTIVRSNDWKHALSKHHHNHHNHYCGSAIVEMLLWERR